MGVFEHFPYTNFHGLNLDWLLHKVQALDIQNEHQAQQIADLEAWIDGANLEEMIDDRLQEMLDNGDFNDIVAQALGVLITPQALGYPGTKTADEAFTLMQSFTVNPIAIPAGTYTLTAEYRLQNVVADDGIYPGYVPMYKRNTDFDMMGFTVGDHIPLPLKESYIEAACWLNGYCYAAVWNYNQTYDYLIKYDGQMNQLLSANMTRPVPDGFSQHASRNVYTDGTYIYVDFTKNTYKYKADDLSLVAMYTHDQYATEYFNGSFWGVTFSGSAVLIAQLNNNFTVSNTTVVDRKVTPSNFQNITIHNGLLYIPALPGDVTTVIDLYDMSYNNIYYNDQMEIEKIAFRDNTPYFFGHTIGIMGQFQTGPYNGGHPTNYAGRYTFDGSDETIEMSVYNKFGVYDFSNYQIGSYGNSGKLFICDDVIFAKVDNYFLVRNATSGGWRICGADREVIFYTGTAGVYYRLEPNGVIVLDFLGYSLSTAALSTISYDASLIWEMLGLGSDSNFAGVIFGRSDDSPDPKIGFGGAVVTATRTSIIIRPFNLIGSKALLYVHDRIIPRFS